MIKVQITGGIGNQMFQYAIGRKLSLINKDELELDTLSLNHKIKLSEFFSFRKYRLGVFNIHARISFISRHNKFLFLNNALYIVQKIALKLASIFLKDYIIKEKKPYTYDASLLQKRKYAYLIGYFQTEKYFKDIRNILLEDFSVKEPLSEEALNWEKLTKDTLSVSLHVRRGDYVTNPHHVLQNLEYYHRALEVIEKRIDSNFTLFIFSDNIEWVKENFKTSHSTYYVSSSALEDYEEIYIMSKCGHNIIANSSFSWWGAWLNENSEKIVIAPSDWITDEKISVNDVCPDDWVRI